MDEQKVIPLPLTRNRISYAGWVVTAVIGSTLIILMIAGFFYQRENPYHGVVTYLVLPAFLVMGIGLILLGAALEWRRRHRTAPGDYPALPVIDINKSWQRRRVFIGIALVAGFFGVSSIGTYQAYHFTETTTFCGAVCHQVMKPEYTAYHYSPHARVACTECHIGSGATWYVKSKLSGVRQVWATTFGTYKLPIETPLEDLRPARQTCEECHWPQKFSESLERVIWHFASDEVNTPYRTNLLLKVGGGSPEMGVIQGIHWHVSSGVRIRYWARDRERLDIPWVEVTHGDDRPVAYTAPNGPEAPPPGAEIRTMDCIDCHNRPSHIYRSALELVDYSMGRGVLDASLPFFKRYAVEALEREYKSTPEALGAIESFLSEKYKALQQGPRGSALVKKNIDWLRQLYQRNFFPEHKVRWQEYPNHIGHFEFPGCYRCHNDQHRSKTGRTISNRCDLCHDIVDQAQGQSAYSPVSYRGGDFRHPMNMPEIWRGHNCTDCHGPYATQKGRPTSDTTTVAIPPQTPLPVTGG
jgi:hypothetical protein